MKLYYILLVLVLLLLLVLGGKVSDFLIFILYPRLVAGSGAAGYYVLWDMGLWAGVTVRASALVLHTLLQRCFSMRSKLIIMCFWWMIFCVESSSSR
jgi:hypothetical protein